MEGVGAGGPWKLSAGNGYEPIHVKVPLNINAKYLLVADKNASIKKRPWNALDASCFFNQSANPFGYLTWHWKGLCQMGAGGSAYVCVECL